MQAVMFWPPVEGLYVPAGQAIGVVVSSGQ